MANLNRNDGEPGLDQNALAARLGVDRSHVTLLVEEPAARGLIERRLSASGRRMSDGAGRRCVDAIRYDIMEISE